MWPQSLKRSDTTFPSLPENLDFDLTLLRAVQTNPAAAMLRFWETANYAVIVGRSNVIEREVNVAACEAEAIPILRRPSGGGAVVIGPGCLCFSLALPVPANHGDIGISGVTRALMQRLAASLTTAEEVIQVRGISDLVLANQKFSGNSQRWLRTAFLHHGTVLYDFDLDLVTRYLRTPSRQPDYRDDRPHQEFITNLSRSREALVRALCDAWQASDGASH